MLAGCADRYDVGANGGTSTNMVEGTPVVIDFNVNLPSISSTTTTRAMSPAPVVWYDQYGNKHDDRIQDIWALVFDENGLLYEIVQCEPGSYESGGSKPYTPTAGEDSLYYTPFHVVLHATSKPRAVHLVANYDPTKNATTNTESAVFGKFETNDTAEAYWQRIYLDKGIQIEEDENGVIKATDSTLQYFQYVPLVRNYLKVNIRNSDTEGLELLGFYVFNRPTSGTVAPYNSNATPEDPTNPLANYFAVYYNKVKDKYPTVRTYEEIVKEQNYLCNEPTEIIVKNDLSDIDSTGSKDYKFPFVNPDSTIYMYERNIDKTTSYPSFIVFKGIYGGGKDTTYYKADFVYQEKEVDSQNDTVYVTKNYHLIRDFAYTLNITKVHGPGMKTIYEAINSPAMNNFSSSTVTKELTNIASDTARLFVSFTDELFTATDAGTIVELKYKHIPNTSEDSINIVANKMKSRGETVADNEDYVVMIGAENGECIAEVVELSDKDISKVDENDGYRTIKFKLKAPPEDGIASQTITISSSTGLAREITIELSRPMTFKAKKYVGEANDTVTVAFSVPTGLSQRRFPLVYKIHSSNRNIYPNVQHPDFGTEEEGNVKKMPVVVGSVTDKDSDNPTYGDYYFQRTITWEEYSSAKNQNGFKWFNCYFSVVDKDIDEAYKDEITVTGGQYFGYNTVKAVLVE